MSDPLKQLRDTGHMPFGPYRFRDWHRAVRFALVLGNVYGRKYRVQKVKGWSALMGVALYGRPRWEVIRVRSEQ